MAIKTYLIINRHSEKALQACGKENGSAVVQAEITNSANQLWILTGKNALTKIVNSESKKVLDLVCAGTESGTTVQIWDDAEDGESQNWNIKVASRGFRTITNIKSEKVLDIKEFSSENDAVAQIWDAVGGLNQEWKLEEFPAVQKRTSKKKTIPNTAEKMAKKTK